MSIDTTKSIKAITYNGVEIPLAASGGGFNVNVTQVNPALVGKEPVYFIKADGTIDSIASGSYSSSNVIGIVMYTSYGFCSIRGMDKSCICVTSSDGGRSFIPQICRSGDYYYEGDDCNIAIYLLEDTNFSSLDAYQGPY